MKAQSAIEYLMTYGWMLIAVAIAGGSVYSMTGSQCIESVNGFTGGVTVSDFTANAETDELVVLLENNEPNAVQINEVTLEAGGEEINQTETFKIDPGASEPLSLSTGFTASDQCNSYPIAVNYDGGSLSGVETSGTITGGLELVDTPEAPEIESVNQ